MIYSISPKKFFLLVPAMGILFLLGCTKNPPIVSPTTPTLPIVSPASVTTGNIDKEAITDRQTYKNKTYGFSIQFPSTWTFQEEAYGAPVMFFTPLSSPEDLLQENIMISQEKISKEYTLDDLWKIKKDKQTFSGFVEVSNEHIQVNTMDAKKIVYKALQGNVALQFEEVFFIKNAIVYTITYTATEATFNDFIQNVDEMITTFKL